MNPERWQQIKTILDEVLDLPPAQRRAFLDRACEEDPSLRQEVGAYIELDQGLGDFMPEPAAPVDQESPEDTAADLRIGPYRTLRRIGEGGMGTVYLAVREDDFEKRVALKLIRRGMDSEEIVRRFHNERQILAHLDHPNVARLLDGGTTEDGLPYFAMDYVEGESIDKYCDARKLSTPERLELFRQVCAALHFAHQNLVVHRDLKPSNILVTDDGVPKLLDFGIAKLLSPQPGAQTVKTEPGSRPMTIQYASPEQIQDQPITTASDVYSLGVLFYKLLTGRLPCHLDTCGRLQSMRVICEDEPARPSVAVRRREEIPAAGGTAELTPESVSRTRDGDPRKLRRRLAGDVDSIALMAMRKEPLNRYGSVEQFSEDIRCHQEGLPVIARRSTFTYRVTKFARRHKPGLAAVAALLLLGCGFTISTFRHLKRTTLERDRAEIVSKFLEDVFRTSNPNRAKGETVTARELLDRGREKIREGLKEEPQLRAVLMGSMGRVYQNLGFYDEAGELLEDAVQNLREHCRGDDPLLARALNDLGVLSYHQGHYEEAEELLREALAMKYSVFGEVHSEAAITLSNLGSVLNKRRRYPDAEKCHRRALAIRRRIYPGEHPEVANSLNNLTSVLYAQGDFESAEPLFREALEIRLGLYDTEHTEVATSQNNLGRLLHALGGLAEADELYRKALATRRKLLGEEHPAVANTKRNLGLLLATTGEPEEGEALARQALQILRRFKSPGDWCIADAKSILGACLLAQERYPEAEPLLVEGYRNLRETRGDSATYTRQARRRIRDLYEAWGKPEKAAEYRDPPNTDTD